MNRADVGRLLQEAGRVSPYRDFVIIGSLSILGSLEAPPAEMVGSVDVDLYPRDDPEGASDIGRKLGLGSAFEAEFGAYADPVSPHLATLPEGWQDRLVPLTFAGGITGWFLEPHDAATSKYARGEERDLRWVRAGLQASVLQPSILAQRLFRTVMEREERLRAAAAFSADRAWLLRNGLDDGTDD